MLFHEIYGTYYQVTAEVLKEASAGLLTRESMMKLIREKGYDPIIPVIVTNTADFTDVIPADEGTVKTGDPILTVIR